MDDRSMTRWPSSYQWWLFLAVVAVTLLIPALFILVAGKNPITAYASLLSYTLGTRNGFYEVITQCIPLVLVSLGVAVAFRAGVFNIGGDGQLLSGAMLSFVFAPYVAHLPMPLNMLVYLFLGFVGGGLLGMFVGWLKVRFRASEIITTIVLNFIVLQVLSWLIRGPLQEPARLMPWSDYLPESLILFPIIDGSRIHAGLFVAIAAVIIMAVIIGKTSFGYKLTAVGKNPFAARYAGLKEGRIIVLAMLVSGGLAGLAGSIQVAAIHERLQDDFASGYGEAAIAIALMARLSPAFIPLAALLFGVFYVGAGVLQREVGVPFPIVKIIEGVVILGFLCFEALSNRRKEAH
ncbi:ABC transporter permease [Pusillimonas sp. DMV24BSW_D]|uniref:ABC transporter permease n=1 Tax=Neopusillimonas aestuarii TaxID=2716226 RepID=UPI00140BA31C|nr:ABC transporter permease [Pusillimonas sp. DMV24BSW_D]QIM48290.1 ABC transporter permease [Pusillimonas sp. DMV24BSW_D]